MQWKIDPTNARIAQLATDVATLNSNFMNSIKNISIPAGGSKTFEIGNFATVIWSVGAGTTSCGVDFLYYSGDNVTVVHVAGSESSVFPTYSKSGDTVTITNTTSSVYIRLTLITQLA